MGEEELFHVSELQFLEKSWEKTKKNTQSRIYFVRRKKTNSDLR